MTVKLRKSRVAWFSRPVVLVRSIPPLAVMRPESLFTAPLILMTPSANATGAGCTTVLLPPPLAVLGVLLPVPLPVLPLLPVPVPVPVPVPLLKGS